ncbi:MAG: O-antigen ligase family protein [Thermoanaerobaculia bacterium]
MEISAPRRLGPWSAESRERLRFGLYASHLLTLFGIAVSNVALGLAILAYPALRNPADEVFRRARPLLLATLAYSALLVVSVLFSQEPATSFASLSEFFTLAALPLALGSLAGERRVRWLFDALIFAAMLAALAGLGQFWIGFGSLDRRIRGPFPHVMTFSGVLLLIDLLLVARLLFRPAGGADEVGAGRGRGFLDRPWVAWTALAAINLALVGSLTRNAWLGSAVGGAWLIWMRRRSLLALALPAALAFVVIAPVPILARALSAADLSDESSYDRLCMLEAGVRMVAEHPLLGVGPNMVERLYPIYRHSTAARLNVPHLHNTYMQIAAERGLPSLVSYLVLVAVAIARAWRGYRSDFRPADPAAPGLAGGSRLAAGPRGRRADLWLGVIAGLLGFSVAGLFEQNWGDVEVQRVALVLLAVPFCLRIGTAEQADSETG